MTAGKRRGLLWVSVCSLLAGVLRVPGLFTAFWLDEIWALRNVGTVHSAIQVLTAIHHDSNHYLTSLWMVALGEGQAFAWYRLPSYLAGVAAVAAAGALARADREGRPVLTMFLVAVSFPLIFYSSEARGYSLAILAGLLSIHCLVRFAENGRARFFAGYALSAPLGLLAHLSFGIVLAASTVFGLVLVGRGRMRIRTLLALQSPPLGALAALFALDLRLLRIGGGPHETPSRLLVRTLSVSIGGPVELPGASFFAALVAVLLIAELVRRIQRFWPERDSTDPGAYLWVFYAAVISIPLWLALVLDPPFLFPRYFLVSIAFVPLLAASLVGALGRRRGAVLLALLLGANAWGWIRFAREGRGHYQEALERILEPAPGDDVAVTVTVGSDQDFRNEMIVDFYRERLGERARRLTYVPRQSGAAEFWIGSLSGSTCDRCPLLGIYPSSALSGATWRLYRRDRSINESGNGQGH